MQPVREMPDVIQIFTVIGLRESLDTVVCGRVAVLHFLPPPILNLTLTDLGAMAVEAEKWS